jgi:hypothetical protein
MFHRKCPRVDELEALVMGRSVPDWVRRHIEQCSLCGPVVEELRTSTELLAQLREAAADSPDEATRERVQEIRGRVARDSRARPLK